MKKLVIAAFDVHGTHYWELAPDLYKVLNYIHGHIFHFEVKIEVQDSDREIEFLELRQEVQRILMEMYNSGGEPIPFGPLSCEMIAIDLKIQLANENHYRVHSIKVMEDQFVGAEVIFS